MRVRSLAIFSGQPTFKTPLRVGQPQLVGESDFIDAVQTCFSRQWVTNDGPVVQQFEKQTAEQLQVRHCIAVSNATLGLQLVARALSLKGEVIMPAFTFVATAHAFKWLDIEPVFCDVDPKTYQISPQDVESKITEATSAIVGVHLWGQACDVSTLKTIADRHRLRLIFDAAHAWGCTALGQPIGQFGDCEVFSFHATKVIHAFEGGLIATNNDVLAHQLKMMRNFGFETFDQVGSLGINAKMTEISAAMGLVSLTHFEDIKATCKRHHYQYQQVFQKIPGLKLMKYRENETSNYYYIVVEVDAHQTGFTRDQLTEILGAENIQARRYFSPGVHKSPPYSSKAISLPHTEHLSNSLLSLPSGTTVSEDDINQIGCILETVIENREVILTQLESRQAVGS